MRKAIKFIIIFAILLPVVLVGAGAAVLYGLFYDSATSPIVKDENFNNETLVEDIIYHSFEDVKESKALTIGLNEHDINQLLLIAMDSLNSPAKQFVGAPYVDISEDNKTLDVYIHASVPIFKTKVKLSTTIDFARLGEEQDHREGILFKINDIKIGRTSVDNVAIGIAKQFINDQAIQDVFKNAGFNIKCNLDEKALFYSVHDLLNDVMKDSNINPFYLSMVDMIVERDLLGVSYKQDSFGLDFKLDKLLSNALADDSRDLGYDDKINEYLDNVETLLTNNVISQDKVELVLNYLCDGYAKTSVDNLNFIKDLDLSSINISDYKSHLGLNNVVKENLDDAFKKQIPTDELELANILLSQEFNVTFKESDFNKTLLSSNIIGKMIPFVFKGPSAWHVNAIFIDDFYINILDNMLNFVISVNIAGLQTKLIVPCQIENLEGGSSMLLNIQDIYYGQVKANNKMSQSCIGYISDAIANLNSWFTKGEGNQIIFSLKDCIEQIPDNGSDILKTFKNQLQSGGITTKLSGITSQQDGELNIKFKYAYSI